MVRPWAPFTTWGSLNAVAGLGVPLAERAGSRSSLVAIAKPAPAVTVATASASQRRSDERRGDEAACAWVVVVECMRRP